MRALSTHTATTTELPAELRAGLHDFLSEAFDGDFGAEDWAHALGGRHFWIEDERGFVAHASVVPRVLVCSGRPLLCGYVEAVATRADARRRGHGTAVMTAVAHDLSRRYDLGALSSNADAFYAALGWEWWRGATGVVRDLSSLTGAWDPTPDDDGGVMILRTPRTPFLDVDGTILCERRAGDVW